jgi:hypothetical protein
VDREDKEVRARLVRLGVRSKTVITPRRSLCLTQDQNSEAKRLQSNDEATGINELPREIDKTKLEDIDSDKEKQETFYRDIRYRFNGIDTNTDLTTFIFSYNNKEREGRNKQPAPIETEYLCGLLNHPLNDIWIPPILPELSGRSYLPYLQDFYSQAESYQKVSCAGLIPHIARLEIRQLRDLYARLGLNYFVMDMVGNINETVRMIDMIEKQSGAPCFLHAINVPTTKAHQNKPVVPAKDILLFEMGFNCFGSSHVRRWLPDEIAEKLRSTAKRPFRLFNRKDYGYYRDNVTGLREMLKETQPTATYFDDFTSGLTGNKVGTLEKLFNVERHALEAASIRKKLIESENVGKYIQSKTRIPDGYLRKIFDVSKGQSLL